MLESHSTSKLIREIHITTEQRLQWAQLSPNSTANVLQQAEELWIERNYKDWQMANKLKEAGQKWAEAKTRDSGECK